MTDPVIDLTARRTAKTRKGGETRTRIVEAALDLFLERGYEAATMRVIAERAGVSLGSAYYYFESKEHLIQGFYARTHEEHLAACQSELETASDLQRRLALVVRSKLETSMPYHRFAGILFKTAADPQSPLNPFSEPSRPLREEATRLLAEVLEGSQTAVHHSLKERLPQLLWLYLMGILLFWIHDRSPGCERSFRLIDRSSALITRMIKMANLPPMRPLVRAALEMLDDLEPREPPAAT